MTLRVIGSIFNWLPCRGLIWWPVLHRVSCTVWWSFINWVPCRGLVWWPVFNWFPGRWLVWGSAFNWFPGRWLVWGSTFNWFPSRGLVWRSAFCWITSRELIRRSVLYCVSSWRTVGLGINLISWWVVRSIFNNYLYLFPWGFNFILVWFYFWLFFTLDINLVGSVIWFAWFRVLLVSLIVNILACWRSLVDILRWWWGSSWSSILRWWGSCGSSTLRDWGSCGSSTLGWRGSGGSSTLRRGSVFCLVPWRVIRSSLRLSDLLWWLFCGRWGSPWGTWVRSWWRWPPWWLRSSLLVWLDLRFGYTIILWKPNP